ncbi:DUF2294 domain-containing protein [Fodinisporobacter ferrooxydans]|uniref:DUF2294 domain-containing protein n=1 Tax=Fodinisporobacter ferrooxydans TaxID=2901836 RepID=A0ABY4CFD9_9BACL|nr:DUF2294 domain-containing protein [Alicyclobacillaceae bacterium MYW30-H2]
MKSKESAFNEIIRKVRKDLFGKGPERIRTVFLENMAITTLYGNLTPTEKFIAKTAEGAEMIHAARTKMIQQMYKEKVPEGLEELMDAKLQHLFSDFHVDDDMAVSIFIFDKSIDSVNNN